MISLQWALITSITLFGVGMACVVASRNALRILMGIELMLNAVNLAAVAFAGVHPAAGNPGPVLAMFVMTVEAAEATLGLAIFLLVASHYKGINVEKINLLKW